MGKHFLLDPVEDNIVKEIDDAGTTIADYTTEPYLFGDLISQHRDGQSYFYHYDGQGSTTSLTDSTAIVTDTYAYSAFGEATGQVGVTVNPFRFLGQEGVYFDMETGDYIVRKLVYDSTIARTLSLSFLLFDYFGPYNFGIYDADNPGVESRPGARASEGATCSFALWTQSRIDKDGNLRDISKEPAYRFLRCQARCAAPEGFRQLVNAGTPDITEFIKEKKCCTIYVCGHQGGLVNLGGVFTYDEKDQPYYIFGPKAKLADIEAIRDAFYANGCKTCAINIFACGTSGDRTQTAEAAEKAEKYREKLALITGCTVCGSTRFLSTLRQATAKDEGGILGVPEESLACTAEDAADQKGRPPWKYSCALYDEKKDPDKGKKDKIRKNAIKMPK